MRDYVDFHLQVRHHDFSIGEMAVEANNETLVKVQHQSVTLLFTQERFTKFAADVAAFMAGKS